MSDDSLQRLLDERDIVDVATRYCGALDTRDWGRLGEVFVPDATAELGDSGLLSGLEQIAATCRAALSPLDASHHLVGNHEVDVDGDAATHRCYVHAQHVRRGADGGRNYVVAGRYEDRLVRTSNGWRIVHRDLIVTWTDGNRRVLAADR